MIEIEQLRGMTEDELVQKETELRREAFNLRYQLLAGRAEKPTRVREVRRDIARIHTIRGERHKAAARTKAQTANQAS